MDNLHFDQFPLSKLEAAAEFLENESDLTDCSVLKYVYAETAKNIRKNFRERKRAIGHITKNVRERRSQCQ